MIIDLKKRFLLAGCVFAAFAFTTNAGAAVTCDPDNGGISLPAGFCAVVAADGLALPATSQWRRMGTSMSLQGRRGQGGGVVALRDTEGKGKLTMKETIGVGTNLTGVQLRNGYMYVASPTQVIRYKMTPGQLKPTGEAEIVVADLPEQRMHEDKGIAFDGKVGSTSTWARLRTPARRRTVAPKCPARIRARCSNSMAESGSSMRTS